MKSQYYIAFTEDTVSDSSTFNGFACEKCGSKYSLSFKETKLPAKKITVD